MCIDVVVHLQVNVKLRLPAILNKFLQPITVSAEEFFPQWRSLSGPPLKLQEVVHLLLVLVYAVYIVIPITIPNLFG